MAKKTAKNLIKVTKLETRVPVSFKPEPVNSLRKIFYKNPTYWTKKKFLANSYFQICFDLKVIQYRLKNGFIHGNMTCY